MEAFTSGRDTLVRLSISYGKAMVTFPQHRYCVSLRSRYGLNGEKHVLRFNCGQSYRSVFTIASNCSDNNTHNSSASFDLMISLPSSSVVVAC